MTVAEQLWLAGLDNQVFALMSRLHVMLRRQSGRVTDIEYMRVNIDYCRHVLDIATQVEDDDLQQVCAKLHEIYFGPAGLFVQSEQNAPLLDRLNMTAKANPEQPAQKLAVPVEAVQVTDDDVDRSYIGRLR